MKLEIFEISKEEAKTQGLRFTELWLLYHKLKQSGEWERLVAEMQNDLIKN
jgi:hypothetical protein